VINSESLVGRGGIGGFLLSPASIGDEVARLALRILGGEPASNIPVTVGNIVRPIFDWRQMQRWGVKASSLPAGSEIRFRDPTPWQQYGVQVIAVSVAILLQAALIGWLIYEHRRRHLAEIQSRQAMADLTFMNRRAAAGELSAAIAHEVNQPLTGIATRASAALRWLHAETPALDKVGASLEQIVTASHRAADIVASIRAMFRKDTRERHAVDINQIILTVLSIVRIDLRRNDIEVRTLLDEQLPIVHGDKVQLQQVVLNLVMNAIDAMQSVQTRVLKLQTESKPGTVRVSIEDTGTGIGPTKPLFTTKASGTGMGLAICHSIIEGHNGRIWVSPGATGGSIFQFELPAIV
jgi:C4-dicarboxylate-specific signal transduction histidine kinase